MLWDRDGTVFTHADRSEYTVSALALGRYLNNYCSTVVSVWESIFTLNTDRLEISPNKNKNFMITLLKLTRKCDFCSICDLHLIVASCTCNNISTGSFSIISHDMRADFIHVHPEWLLSWQGLFHGVENFINEIMNMEKVGLPPGFVDKTYIVQVWSRIKSYIIHCCLHY